MDTAGTQSEHFGINWLLIPREVLSLHSVLLLRWYKKYFCRFPLQSGLAQVEPPIPQLGVYFCTILCLLGHAPLSSWKSFGVGFPWPKGQEVTQDDLNTSLWLQGYKT